MLKGTMLRKRGMRDETLLFFLVISSFLLHFFYFVSFPRSPVARHPPAASLALYFLFSFIGFAALVHFPISNRPVGYASGFIGATPESNLEVLRTYIHTLPAAHHCPLRCPLLQLQACISPPPSHPSITCTGTGTGTVTDLRSTYGVPA